jgi:hypothetical protein
MAEIVNLRLVRKAQARAKAAAKADANRARFGRSRAQKRLDQSRQEKLVRSLDLHRLDAGDQSTPRR